MVRTIVGDQAADHPSGCERCWPAGASAAWEARRGLTRAVELVDEPHFHVMILVCPHCAQAFISVFTETVDWADGEDPQHWTLVPIATADAAALAGRRQPLTAAALEALAAGRRCLRHDHPKGAPAPLSAWSTGLFIGPHD